jgi:hypothetical protein
MPMRLELCLVFIGVFYPLTEMELVERDENRVQLNTVKTTLETSGEDVKTTPETSGEDVKSTLETSGKDVSI